MTSPRKPDSADVPARTQGESAPAASENHSPAVMDASTVRTDPASQKRDIEEPRHIIRQGLLIIALFFGALGLWSVLGHINGAVVAPGTIKIESERKTVQHLEGGIIQNILVSEGDEVTAGQALIMLESVEIDASAAMFQKQLLAQEAERVRRLAEKGLEEALHWPDELREEPNSREVLEREESIFYARREAMTSQLSLIETQLAQLDAQKGGFQDQIRAENAIIATLHEELEAKRQLYAERYVEKSQILELERVLAQHQGERGRLRQSVAEVQERAAELHLRSQEIKVRFVEEATSALGMLENEIVQTRERLRPLRDARERLEITAPVSGRVVDLKVHSRGGVVRSGEPLMDIVPHDNPLIIETRVPVNKITEVRPGQEALIQMDAFDTRLVPHIPGKVVHLSADRLEEQTGAGAMPYYLCYVEVDPIALEEEELWLFPGMPVTVFITTGRSTVLYYMLEPLIKNWDRALRE